MRGDAEVWANTSDCVSTSTLGRSKGEGKESPPITPLLVGVVFDTLGGIIAVL